MALSAAALPSSPSSIVSKAGSTMPWRRRGGAGAGRAGSTWEGHGVVWGPAPPAARRRCGSTGRRPPAAAAHLAVAGHAAQLLVGGGVVYQVGQRAVGQEVGVQQQHDLRGGWAGGEPRPTNGWL